jgi:hypothetical protein
MESIIIDTEKKFRRRKFVVHGVEWPLTDPKTLRFGFGSNKRNGGNLCYVKTYCLRAYCPEGANCPLSAECYPNVSEVRNGLDSDRNKN